MTISNSPPLNNNAQEALETAAQTRAEALKGDQQAARKLASQTAASTVPNQQPPVQNSRSGLDVKA